MGTSIFKVIARTVPHILVPERRQETQTDNQTEASWLLSSEDL